MPTTMGCSNVCPPFFTGLMITGFAKASQALGDDAYLKRAVRTASFIKGHLYNAEKGVLIRNGYRDTDG